MYDINALIPFECIVDIDMGLIKLLKYNYRNLDFFFEGILDGPDDCIRYELTRRKNKNPLVVAANMKKIDIETLDNWYSQFLEKEYDNIIESSDCTALADLVKLSSFNTDKVIKTTILCKSQKEADIVSNRALGQSHIIVSDKDIFDMSAYDTIYIKNVYDIEKYSGIIGKTIYIGNYGFNIIDNNITDDIILNFEPLIKYLDDNEINIYTVYNLNPKFFN